jgi:hypothetical protein
MRITFVQSAPALHVYLFAVGRRSLSLLLYSLARLKVQPPPAWQQQLAAALHTHLIPSSSSSNRVRRYSGVDLCLLLWSLPALCLAPPPAAAVLTAALQRSQRHLTELDCSYLTALLVSEGCWAVLLKCLSAGCCLKAADNRCVKDIAMQGKYVVGGEGGG